jgi:hypothetical protein
MTSLTSRLYSTLVDAEEDHGCRELPESSCREVPGNAAKLVAGFTLQRLGDQIADPKTVLAWMLTSTGAPDFAIAMLVPIRESGSLLPQAGLLPLIRRFPYRKRSFGLGAVLQGGAVVGIGIGGALLMGAAAGLVILGFLALFALARAVSSLSSQDLIGKTIPRGNRGTVHGIAASAAGLAAIAAGVGIAIGAEGGDPVVLALLVGGSATLWLGAGGTLLTVDEQPSEGEALDRPPSVVEAVALFREDAPFRTFVVARSLMMSTALVSPLIVSLSAQVSEAGASGVGPFVIATGVAALIASPIWGRLADQSSRLVMAVASASSGLIALGFIAGRAAGLDSTAWLGPATYLLLAIVHAGARMGRKTYVVDLGHGDRRTRYVAVSNSIIGVALLVAGGVVAVLSQIGPVWALSALATAGPGGGLASLRMREIHRSV